MISFWNERYRSEKYVYGKLPNVFLKGELERISTKGKLLLPAEGEGRNAAYAASIGWDVTAFDPSEEGKIKAMKLAEKIGVSYTYELFGYQEIPYEAESFDVIGLTFAHMPPELRKVIHAKYVQLLKPGGTLIMEAFSKEQINYNTGGPQQIDMLFSTNELMDDFKALQISKIEIAIETLNEGEFHQGAASVIQLVASKPK